MDKEKEIEEMVEFISKNKLVEDSEWIANGLYDIGYRKADEVRKETARKILRELWANAEFETLYDNDDGGYVRLGELEQIAEKYGVEVDE